MGTANFMYRDRLFVCPLTCDCAEQEGEDYMGCDCALFNHQDLLDEIGNDLEERKPVTKGKFTISSKKYYIPEWDKNRNFNGRLVGRITVETQFFGYSIRAYQDIIVRSGYYEGANIDRCLGFETDSLYDTALDSEESMQQHTQYLIEAMVENDTFTYAQGDYQRQNLDKRLEQIDSLLEELYVEIGKRYGSEYEVSARFSNGETHYKKIA